MVKFIYLTPVKTKDKIIHAAKDVFHQKGLDGARMQEIADKSGINKALLHYHFKNKETLFRAVFLGAMVEIFPAILQLLNEDKPLQEKIPNVVNMYINRISENPQLPRFVLNELNQNPQVIIETLQGMDTKPTRFIQQVHEAVAAGNLNPTEPFQVVSDIISLCAFPFIAKPMLQMLSGMNEAEFKRFIEERKMHVSELLLQGLFIDNSNN